MQKKFETTATELESRIQVSGQEEYDRLHLQGQHLLREKKQQVEDEVAKIMTMTPRPPPLHGPGSSSPGNTDTHDQVTEKEPAIRCRAPPEGRGGPGGTPGGVGSTRGPREGPRVSDPGGVARQGSTWPAFLERGAVLRITDADANHWLPRALRSALAHWRYRRRNPPPPQPQPPHKRQRR